MFKHDLAYGRRVWREFFDRGRLHIETDERRFDGTPINVEGDYLCFYDAERRITGHFGIQRDVTERMRIEDELRVYREHIEKHAEELESQNIYLQDELKVERNFGDIVSCAPAMAQVFKSLEMVAATDSTVLVLGETGTGKELIARAHPQPEPAPRLGDGQGQLRRASGRPRGERVVRSRERARSPARSSRRKAGSSSRTTGRFSSTKSGSCRPTSR